MFRFGSQDGNGFLPPFLPPFHPPSLPLPLSVWVSQLSNIIELNIKKSCVVDLEDTQSVSVVRGSYFLEEGDSLDS